MVRAWTLAMTFVFALAAFAQTPPASPIEWDADPSSVRVSISPSDLSALAEADLPRVLSVSVEPPNVIGAIGLPAIVGTHVKGQGSIDFRPRYPFEPGVSYRATFQRPGQSPITSTFRIPRQPLERTTVVTTIYPTADTLPQNLLKFYLHFSAPMRGGHIYEHIRLTGQDGTPIELPFLEIDEELWNPQMTRLTLFLDPGRIKREVKPLEEVGPALVPGKKYRLRVDARWQDAAGAELKQPFEKLFTVVEPDRTPPDPKNWTIRPPSVNTTAPVEIKMEKPMDQALALRMIAIKDLNGAYVHGAKTLDEQETLWRFAPGEPWQPGRYLVLIQSTIEDLAGNNIGKPFEVELAQGDRREPPKTLRLSFQVK